jgi:hypothetical protein
LKEYNELKKNESKKQEHDGLKKNEKKKWELIGARIIAETKKQVAKKADDNDVDDESEDDALDSDREEDEISGSQTNLEHDASHIRRTKISGPQKNLEHYANFIRSTKRENFKAVEFQGEYAFLIDAYAGALVNHIPII